MIGTGTINIYNLIVLVFQYAQKGYFNLFSFSESGKYRNDIVKFYIVLRS
jgi:hypothetical protein